MDNDSCYHPLNSLMKGCKDSKTCRFFMIKKWWFFYWASVVLREAGRISNYILNQYFFIRHPVLLHPTPHWAECALSPSLPLSLSLSLRINARRACACGRIWALKWQPAHWADYLKAWSTQPSYLTDPSLHTYAQKGSWRGNKSVCVFAGYKYTQYTIYDSLLLCIIICCNDMLRYESRGLGSKIAAITVHYTLQALFSEH